MRTVEITLVLAVLLQIVKLVDLILTLEQKERFESSVKRLSSRLRAVEPLQFGDLLKYC